MEIVPGMRAIYVKFEHHMPIRIRVLVLERKGVSRNGAKLWKVQRLDLPAEYDKRHSILVVAASSLREINA